jgi:hypothetical protein
VNGQPKFPLPTLYCPYTPPEVRSDFLPRIQNDGSGRRGLAHDGVI